jgi:hypothetical protein
MPDASTLGLETCVLEYAVARMALMCWRGVASAREAVMAGITERDFGALHGLLDVDHIDDSGPGMPWRFMANLKELFHSDNVTFQRSNTVAQQSLFEQSLSDVQEYVDYSDADADTEAEYWKLYWLTDACNYPDCTGDIAHVTKVSDSCPTASGEPAP